MSEPYIDWKTGRGKMKIFFFFLNKAFAVDLPELCFLHLWGVEEQLVSMMDQLTKAFFPWLCVK